MSNVELDKPTPIRNNNRLTILHISSDDIWGGAESQLSLLLEGFEELKKDSFKSVLVTLNEGKLFNLFSAKIPTFYVPENHGLISIIKSTLKVIRENEVQLIVTHGYKEAFIGFCLSKFSKCKWLHQIHGNNEGYRGIKFLKHKIYSTLERTLSRYFAEKIVFVSQALRKDCGFENWHKSTVIYNAARKPRNIEKISTTPIYKIAIIGRIAAIKRIDIAIDAFSYVLNSMPSTKQQMELHIAGSGPLLEKMREKALDLDLLNTNIFFDGFVENVNQYLSEMSLLILTSDSEGLPTILLESAHLGIPILARQVGGVAEIKENLPKYPLFLVRSADPKDFARALIEIIKKMPDLDKSKNYETDFFSEKRLINDHSQVYSTILLGR